MRKCIVEIESWYLGLPLVLQTMLLHVKSIATQCSIFTMPSSACGRVVEVVRTKMHFMWHLLVAFLVIGSTTAEEWAHTAVRGARLQRFATQDIPKAGVSFTAPDGLGMGYDALIEAELIEIMERNEQVIGEDCTRLLL